MEKELLRNLNVTTTTTTIIIIITDQERMHMKDNHIIKNIELNTNYFNKFTIEKQYQHIIIIVIDY